MANIENTAGVVENTAEQAEKQAFITIKVVDKAKNVFDIKDSENKTVAYTMHREKESEPISAIKLSDNIMKIRFVSLSKLDGKDEIKIDKMGNVGAVIRIRYELNSDEQAKVDELQAQIDAIVAVATARYNAVKIDKTLDFLLNSGLSQDDILALLAKKTDK